MSNDLECTPQQLQFVENYVATKNARRAARAAGYSDKSAGYLMKLSHVKQAIAERQVEVEQQINERLEFTYDKLVGGLLEVIEYELGNMRYKLGSTGKPIRDERGEQIPTRSNINILKAYELLAKCIGAFKAPEENKNTDLLARVDEARKRAFGEDQPLPSSGPISILDEHPFRKRIHERL